MRKGKNNNDKNNLITKKKWFSIVGFLISIVLLSIAITLSMNEEKISREAKVNKEALNQLNRNIIVLEQASSSISKDINEVKNSENKDNDINKNETTGNQGNTIDTNASDVKNQEIINSNENNNDRNTDNTSNNNINSENTNNNNGNGDNASNNNGNNDNASNNNGNNDNTSNKNENNNENSNKSNGVDKKANSEGQKFIMPIEGERLTSYSMNSLVYSNTLGEWITHRGIDIKAEKTTVVKAAASGTVKAIKNDPRYGLSITIEHSNGFQTVYSSLLSTEFVKEGDQVEQGKSIGTVGNSAVFETADGSHLHFELLKDGEYVNPDIYLK